MRHWTFYRFCEVLKSRLSLLDRIKTMSAYDTFTENTRHGVDMANSLKRALWEQVPSINKEMR